jgi:glycosyltransferase involved in cell wall biosynthesis
VNQAATSCVLHLVPPNGGGVDRFVRDLCSLRPDDWLLHVSDDQCVLECPAQDLLVPVAATELGALVERGVLGRATALHVHSTVAPVRRMTQLFAAGMDLPYVVTLHDIEFAGNAEPDDRAERFAFIRSAARCTVPSGFMRDVAIAALGDSLACVVVENGVDALAPAAGAPGPEQCPVAVIGAVGQHKGLAHLLAVAGALPAGLHIVLIGYADGQLGAGWLGGDRIRVHGAFEPAQLPELVAHYAAKLAFFPKGQPESYCYALSDAWLAGLPVVGPDCGAIGERVRAHGGGSLYDPEAAAADVALAITTQLAAAESGRADVSAAVRSLTSIAAMVDRMNGIYTAIAAPATAV